MTLVEYVRETLLAFEQRHKVECYAISMNGGFWLLMCEGTYGVRRVIDEIDI